MTTSTTSARTPFNRLLLTGAAVELGKVLRTRLKPLPAENDPIMLFQGGAFVAAGPFGDD